jgi:hypothetical protein
VDQTNVPVAGGNKQFYFTMPKNNVIIDIEAKTKVEDNVTVNNVHNGYEIPYEFSRTEARTNDPIRLSITNPETDSYNYSINGLQRTFIDFEYNKQVTTTFTLTREEIVQECEHSYSSVVTSPTCTEQGYTTYTCTECGHSYEDDY